MNQILPLNNPFTDPDGPTLQDVQCRVESAKELIAREVREMLSGINSFSLWHNRVPSQIPANHDYLRRAFDRLTPAGVGVGNGRFDNVQSLLKRALLAAGIPTLSRTYLAPMSEDWKQLWEAIPNSYSRESLARLFRFASGLGLAPAAMEDGVIDALFKALVAEDMTAKPETAVQSAVRLWNRMVDSVPGWPQIRLTPRIRRERYTLTWNDLPIEFVADVDHHLAILGGVDPTHPKAPRKRLEKLSLQKRRYQILQLVSGMHHKGVNVADLHSLADLCNVDYVRLGLNYFIDRHRERHGADADPGTSMIGGIADMIRGTAKHYADAAPDVVSELTRIASRLNHKIKGMSEKVLNRLAQVNTPLKVGKLLVYPRTEMQKLATMSNPTRQDAVRYSVLLAMQILIFAPMRISNIAGLDIDRHFVWPPKRKGAVGVIIPRAEVKNHKRLDYKIPESYTHYLFTFIDRVRPLLLSGPSGALFPISDGRAKRSDTLSKQIKKLMYAELGLVWHAHLFRHLTALIKSMADPDDFEGLRRLLAHDSVETTITFYEGMRMGPAVERYDQLIDSLTDPDPGKPPRPRRPSNPRRKK